MDSVSASIVNAASLATQLSVQSTAATLVLRTAMDLQAATATQLVQALPQPQLASSGTVGTLVNAVA